MRRQSISFAVVEWVDASWDSKTMLPDEIDPLVTLWEMGWLVGKDRDSITLALEFSPRDGTYRHTVSIPRVGIKRMQPKRHHWGKR